MKFSDIDKFRNSVERYVITYYTEVRSQLSRYKSLSDVFPEYLVGCKRVHLTFCNNGLLIAHYANDKDTFEYSISQQSTEEVFFRISKVKFGIKFPNDMEFTMVNEFLYKWDSTELSKQIASQVGVSPWDKVLRTSRTDSARWSDRQARADATFDIATFITAHLMDLKKSQTDKLFDNLKSAIDSFKTLIDSEPREGMIQSFLTQNPVLLVQTAIRVVSQLQLGSEHRPDFMVELSPSEYLLVEIKQANFKLFTKDGDPSQELKHAERQVLDWLAWVKDFNSYAKESMPGIIEPECWVVIGRRKSMNNKELRRLKSMNMEKRNVTILTYDDLIDKAEQYLRNLQRFQNN